MWSWTGWSYARVAYPKLITFDHPILRDFNAIVLLEPQYQISLDNLKTENGSKDFSFSL